MNISHFMNAPYNDDYMAAFQVKYHHYTRANNIIYNSQNNNDDKVIPIQPILSSLSSTTLSLLLQAIYHHPTPAMAAPSTQLKRADRSKRSTTSQTFSPQSNTHPPQTSHTWVDIHNVIIPIRAEPAEEASFVTS